MDLDCAWLVKIGIALKKSQVFLFECLFEETRSETLKRGTRTNEFHLKCQENSGLDYRGSKCDVI